MRASGLKRHLETVIVAAITAIVASTAPSIAHGIRHALFAHDSGAVDGKSAVGASATLKQRRGKLVATNQRTGLLPNSIIPTVRRAADLACTGCLDGNEIMDGALGSEKLDFDPATQAEVDTFASSLQDSGSINDAGNPIHWTKLLDVPASLADGTDDAGGSAGGDLSGTYPNPQIAQGSIGTAEMATTPHGTASRHTLQNIPEGVVTKVTLDNAYSAGGVTFANAADELVVPVSGTYLLVGTVTFASDPDGVRSIVMYRNGQGNLLMPSTAVEPTETVGAPTITQLTAVESLNAGDAISLRVSHSAGNDIGVTGLLSVVWLSH